MAHRTRECAIDARMRKTVSPTAFSPPCLSFFFLFFLFLVPRSFHPYPPHSLMRIQRLIDRVPFSVVNQELARRFRQAEADLRSWTSTRPCATHIFGRSRERAMHAGFACLIRVYCHQRAFHHRPRRFSKMLQHEDFALA